MKYVAIYWKSEFMNGLNGIQNKKSKLMQGMDKYGMTAGLIFLSTFLAQKLAISLPATAVEKFKV